MIALPLAALFFAPLARRPVYPPDVVSPYDYNATFCNVVVLEIGTTGTVIEMGVVFLLLLPMLVQWIMKKTVSRKWLYTAISMALIIGSILEIGRILREAYDPGACGGGFQYMI